MLVGSLLLPGMASAQLLPGSFGGRIVSEAPCISPLGPSLVVGVKSTGINPIVKNYIWTPATITMLVGPPILGGQILGIADIPFACWNPIKGGLFGLFTFLSYSYGQRMTYIGTSFPGGSIPVIGI